MRSGLALMALNYRDWEDRYNVNDFSQPPTIPDSKVWAETIHIAELAEPLGFDSIWAPEHHTTPYCQTPNPLLVLGYMAGRTTNVDFGTMVLVLPWHHPFQIAGEISLLSNLIEGRELYVGMGRGLSGREFGAFGIDQSEARDRYVESVDVIRRALSQEEFSYDGKFYSLPPTHVRPRPYSSDVVHLLGAFGSPSSLPVVANLELEMIFVAGQTIEEIGDNVVEFNKVRANRGLPPNQPRVVIWMYCAETETEIERGLDCMMNFQLEAGGHYQFADLGRFANIKGYEDYASRVATGFGGLDAEDAVRTARQGRRDNNIIGTPEECIEKVRAIQKITQAQEFIYLPQYGGMTVDEAEKSLRLFADKVLPAVHDMDASLV